MNSNSEIYDLSFVDNNDKTIKLSEFAGTSILIVNTASNCGMTYQYGDLQKLRQEKNGMSLTILAFPCNQFGQQEPGTDEEIKTFCSSNYNVTFPISKKIEVNGENAHPIYKYLKKFDNKEIGWNFEKFLITPDGEIVKHFSHDFEVEKISVVVDNMNECSWNNATPTNGWKNDEQAV